MSKISKLKTSLVMYFLVFTFFILLFSIFFINLKNSLTRTSPELSTYSLSPFGKQYGKAVAASCAFEIHGSEDEYSPCTTDSGCPGLSQCGGTCALLTGVISATCVQYSGDYYFDQSCYGYACPEHYTLQGDTCIANPCNCSNGSTNPPSCDNNTCLQGITPIVNYLSYRSIISNIYYYNNNTAPTPTYSVGSCGLPLPPNTEKRCEISRSSSDGTNTGSWTENYISNKTNWSAQVAKTYPYTENLRVRCGYWNTNSGSYTSQSSWIQANAAVLHPNYGLPCSNTDNCGIVTDGTFDVNGVCNAPITKYSACTRSNLCGQQFPGITCPTECKTTAAFTNNSCITSFSPSTEQVNPNGSVEFSWELVNSTNTPRCSFVDLTTSTPRPIPGLQNLDSNTDRTRITNIQTSTRFCLVCQFYNSITGNVLGEATQHQWIRVQKISEN